jgi:hypothetical protein
MRRYLSGLLTVAVTVVLGAVLATPAAASDPTLILVPGTRAIFATSASSVAGVACSTSTISFTTTAVTAWTMGTCVANLPSVTGVPSVKFNGLPYVISPASVGTLVIHGVSVTIILVSGDLAVSCGYAAPTVDATLSSAGTSLTFNAQRLGRTSGAMLCPAALFFSARYGPGPA